MKGTVQLFNSGKGLGFIKGQDGKRYFVNEADIEMNGFRTLAEGWEVEFHPTRFEGRTKATGVRVIGHTIGLKWNANATTLKLHMGQVELRIDQLGRVYALSNDPISPETEIEGKMRAYFMGPLRMHGFTLELPFSSSERAFLLLNEQKQPRHLREDGFYEKVNPGSYLLVLESDGHLRIWNLAVRHQGGISSPARNWIVIERRFEHKLDLSREIKPQLPMSGLKRDNDDFLPGIKRAMSFMAEARNDEQARATTPA